MQENKTCMHCKKEKPLEEYFIYGRSGTHYNWCRECVRDSTRIRTEQTKERAKQFKERWSTT